jgi:uncharacterized membrane-anchored protein YhcB (DUF1043 family)
VREGLFFSSTSATLQQHFSNTSATLQQHFSNTSATLQQHFSNTSATLHIQVQLHNSWLNAVSYGAEGYID